MLKWMKKEISVFDFDGTLTYLDTAYPFILFCRGFWGTFFKGLKLLPDFFWYFLGFLSRKQIKEIMLERYFKGKQVSFFQGMAKNFLQKHAWIIKKEMVQKLLECKAKGHQVVIVSANLTPFIQMVRELIPVDHMIATDIELDPQGKITGKILGENCWGPEKLNRFLQFLGDRSHYQVIAYGDSKGDKELLQNADIAHWV